MNDILNGWTGVGVGWLVEKGEVKLRGTLDPGVDSWGKPAFVIEEDCRPEKDHHFGSILSVLEDGRVIPYKHLNGKQGGFDLYNFSYPLPIHPTIPTALTNPTVALPMEEPLLSVGERSLAWVCFWPEWVARQVGKGARHTWHYLVALHTLWMREQEGGSKHDD